MIREYLYTFVIAVALSGWFTASAMPSPADNPGVRYASDAYPGFDDDYQDWRPEKKEPKLFSFWFGVTKTNAAEQLSFAQTCLREEKFAKARRALDALVREWPMADEAPIAQLMLANLIMTEFKEYDNAFDEYRYLLDFYPSRCDYHAVVRKMYEVVKVMRLEGKMVLWFRFANVTDVRHRFESLIVRSPGEEYIPEALLSVAELREEELDFEEAVQVYENLRNHYPECEEAIESYYRESRSRYRLIQAHEYNRNRALDTISFLTIAGEAGLEDEKAAEVAAWKREVERLLDDEAFAAAQFYDSRTRTKASAVSAYERFISEHPQSIHVEEARARLEALKGEF